MRRVTTSSLLSPLLANNGYCVYASTYGQDPDPSSPFAQFGGLDAMEQSAARLSKFVNTVLQSTGARKVDIVGHSEGAPMPDYYIEYLGGAAKVLRYVGVSGVKHAVGARRFAFAQPLPKWRASPRATTDASASSSQ